MLEPEHSRVTRATGNRVRELRSALGISQQDLAELSQLHPTNLGKLERGQGNPKLDTLSRIATALDTTVADLVRDVTAEIVQPNPRRRITAAELIRARDEQLRAEQEQTE